MGLPKPRKSPKLVDFVESARFAEAISKACVDFLDFLLLGPPKSSLAGAEGPYGGGRAVLCVWPGGPRCREALVAGKPSLLGGPRCREALVAGRPSLPGVPRCREALCVAPLKQELWESMWPFSGAILEKGPPRDRPRMCSKSFIL